MVGIIRGVIIMATVDKLLHGESEPWLRLGRPVELEFDIQLTRLMAPGVLWVPVQRGE